MQEVRLTLKKRAFPSQGRVRINIAHLADLGIKEGDKIDLVNESSGKSVTTAVIADTMVREGQIRVSEEDLKSLGLGDEDEVRVIKTPPVDAKIKKMAADAGTSLSKGVDTLGKTAKKTAGDVKAGAAKAAKNVKKTVKKATGPKGDL